MELYIIQGHMTNSSFGRCGFCKNNCNMQMFKNNEIIEYILITLTDFCTTIKLINSTGSNTVGIKSLPGTCDLKIKDKADYNIIISIDKSLYRFFVDLHGISCEFM
jgi:hypothetical protein